MNIKDTMEAAKPIIGGAIGGAVVVLAVAFAGGFVVTTSTMNETVREARVMTLAEVCVGRANEYWLAEGNTAEGLSGWRNEDRAELAEQFLPAGIDADLHEDITDTCGRMLRT
ncbi:hypothetical protein [Fodinicurvata sp. EGI_FJ10296]|uniref:hypothetical protein n=1 Tax=Fodinicurvata sp. EGI_FJ10296 TaxID=3231908 RepID=UPI003456EC13